MGFDDGNYMVMTSIIMVMNRQFPSSFKFWGCENVCYSV